MTPETKVKVAAEMARMMGYELDTELSPGRVLIETGDQGEVIHGERGGLWTYYDPFSRVEQVVAFADWAEREGKIEQWKRFRDREFVVFAVMTPDEAVVRPTRDPFAKGLTEACAWAIPELRKIVKDWNIVEVRP